MYSLRCKFYIKKCLYIKTLKAFENVSIRNLNKNFLFKNLNVLNNLCSSGFHSLAL